MSSHHAISPGISLEIASQTDRGLERAENQDAAFVAPVPGALLAGVCDGMGGVAGGQIASSHAASAIESYVRAHVFRSEPAASRVLFDALEDATQRVFAIASRDRQLEGMGTTATIAAILGDRVVIAQVGDSRAYIYRQGVLTQLTRDQTLVQLLLDRGQLAPDEVSMFPHGNVILQAVGTGDHVDAELWSASLFRDDVLLLCSDGLHGPVGDAIMATTFAESCDPEIVCTSLIGRALAYGGPDNVTCVVVRVTGDSLALPPSARVDVTQCIVPEASSIAEPETPQLEDAVEKAPFSNLWPLRWGPRPSKKTP